MRISYSIKEVDVESAERQRNKKANISPSTTTMLPDWYEEFCAATAITVCFGVTGMLIYLDAWRLILRLLLRL